MTRPSSGRRDDGQRGSALILALFVLVLLTGMGIALLFTAQGEMTMARADQRSKEAYYLAEAGIEDGRASLHATNGNGGFSDDLATAAAGNNQFDVNLLNLAPVYDGNGNVTGFTGYGDDVPLQAHAALGSGWYASFLTNDPVEATNPDPRIDGNGRIMITGIGATASGSVEIVQAIVEQYTPVPTLIPAAITLLGPSPSYTDAQSSGKQYIGDDCGGSGMPGVYFPVVGTVGSTAEADAEAGVDSNPIYTSGPNTGLGTVADLTDPTEDTVSGSTLGVLDTRWNDCDYLHQLAEDIQAIADVSCNDGTSCALPPNSPDRIVFVDDDYTVSADGQGLLWVTGTLDINGSISWNGALYVVGTGVIQRGGGGGGTMQGGTVVARISGPDGIFGNGDDCTEGADGFGSVTYDEGGGGTGATTYCSTDILAALPVFHYPVVDFVQR